MTSGGVSLINMSYWESGKRRIRFLYLTNNNSFNVSKRSTNEVSVPLTQVTLLIFGHTYPAGKTAETNLSLVISDLVGQF